MAESTNISWASFTGSPWFICSEVSSECSRCYARELAERRFAKMLRGAFQKAGYKDWATMPLWGNKVPRVRSKGFWKEAYKFNQKALDHCCGHCEYEESNGQLIKKCKECAKYRPRMFPSMIDWLDKMPAGVIDLDGKKIERWEILGDFLNVVRETPALDWLLLTKRPENFNELLSEVNDLHENEALRDWVWNWLNGQPPANVWVGASTGTQAMYNHRIDALLAIPAVVHWLSIEPLLENITFGTASASLLGWVVVGGESGNSFRDCGVDAIHAAVQQFVAMKVPVFCKQDANRYPGQQGRIPDHIWKRKEYPTA